MLPLNQNELETLRILWEEKEMKPAEIQTRFGWPIENATLRSVLLNLVEKGHVARKLQGKAFHYAARIPKTTLLETMMATLARVFAGGSNRALMAQLVETADLTPADLKFLSQTAAGVPPKKARDKSK
ncbi:MAG: blaI 6 [Verrucomicrobiales bacterium]|nr:blaI 6 [Verrucomicrobiales bacterium]